MSSRIKHIKTKVTEQPSSGRHIVPDNQNSTGCCVNNGGTRLDANASTLYNEREARRIFEEAIKNHDIAPPIKS